MPRIANKVASVLFSDYARVRARPFESDARRRCIARASRTEDGRDGTGLGPGPGRTGRTGRSGGPVHRAAYIDATVVVVVVVCAVVYYGCIFPGTPPLLSLSSTPI